MILKNLQALAIKDTESIYVSKHNYLYLYHIPSNSLKKIFTFDSNVKTSLSKIHPFLRRLLRTDIRYALQINKHELLIVKDRSIYNFSIADNEIISRVEIKRGSRPLNMVQISDLQDFDKGVYFGEYFDNPNMEEVHIYQYKDNALHKRYTFESNTINHIHNLIPDNYRKCVWILAGDFDGAASIYKATNNFKDVKLVVSGSQTYRSCVAFPLPEGLLYATDSQFEQNSIRLLKNSSEKWISDSICQINGSCIYGTSINGEYYFSTAVEAINSGSKIQKLLRNKRGPGIIKNQTEILKVDSAFNNKVLYSNKKDFLPFVLFQFGNIIFPTGKNDTNHLIFTTIATRRNDYSTTIIKLPI